jgi:hypothetical protein
MAASRINVLRLVFRVFAFIFATSVFFSVRGL